MGGRTSDNETETCLGTLCPLNHWSGVGHRGTRPQLADHF
jgi:hypothetical protein